MSERSTKLGRRGFLVRVSAASAAGVGVGAGWALWRQARARFASTDGFPDMPTAVRVEVPSMGALEALEVSAALIIETPRERLVRDLGSLLVRGGAAELPVTLAYPYQELVPGRYSYRVALRGASLTVSTAAAASYVVRPMAWLS
jgi:hypothetical protein